MSILQAPSRSAKTTTIEIKGASYAIEPIDPGFAGVAAARVVKLVNPDCCYDVVLQADGLAVCDCPDYIARHDGKGTQCKHGRALVAAGLLLPPISGGSPAVATPPAAVAPITRADLKRASYFGLALPKDAPMEEPADHLRDVTNMVEAPADHLLGSQEMVEPRVVADPGDSWDSFDDETDAPWGLGPEAEPIEAAPAYSPGFPELAVGFLTSLALRAIEEGRPDDALGLCETLEPDHRAGVDAFMVEPGRPGLGWSSWMALCTNGSPVRFPAPVVEEPRPTRRLRFQPSPEDMAAAAQMFADAYVVLAPRGARPVCRVARPEIHHAELVAGGGIYAARFAS